MNPNGPRISDSSKTKKGSSSSTETDTCAWLGLETEGLWCRKTPKDLDKFPMSCEAKSSGTDKTYWSKENEKSEGFHFDTWPKWKSFHFWTSLCLAQGISMEITMPSSKVSKHLSRHIGKQSLKSPTSPHNSTNLKNRRTHPNKPLLTQKPSKTQQLSLTNGDRARNQTH